MSNYFSLAVLLALMIIVYIFDRKNFKKEASLFYLRRTERGLAFIEKFSSRHKKFFGMFSDLGILFSFGTLGAWYLFKCRKSKGILVKTVVSFVLLYFVFGIMLKPLSSEALVPTSFFGASGFIVAFLLKAAYDMIFLAAAVPGVQLVLPINIPNAPVFFVPIDFWLISIFVILVAHEFSHALVAKAQGINVKSLGYGFLTILPLGFAEPDQEQIQKSKSLVKTRIYGAGSFANFIVALLSIPLFFGVFFAYSNSVIDGVSYESTIEGMPAYGLLPENGIITKINENETNEIYMLEFVMGTFKPGDNISIIVDNRTYNLILAENPDNESKAFIGISDIGKKSSIPGVAGYIITPVLLYIATLFSFIIMLNLGIGLANLLPIKPLDGGLMFEEIAKTAGIRSWKNVVKFVSMFTLVLLLFNIFGGFLF